MKKLILFAVGIFLLTAAFAQQKIAVQFPKVTLAGKSSGEISIAEIVQAGELFATNTGLKVVYFAITLNPGGAVVKENKSNNKLTAEMITYLKSLVPGSVFYLDRVEVANNTGASIKLEPQKFTIK
jgi:hypothetical protein